MPKRRSPPTDDYDSPWKEVIEHFFPAFMAFFFPKAHAEIDWSRPYEFLDQELAKIVRDAKLGKRLADKLVKVQRASGEEVWVLIHIEVQGWVDPEFPRRMYVYNYRVFDRYGHPVASMPCSPTTTRSGGRSGTNMRYGKAEPVCASRA